MVFASFAGDNPNFGSGAPWSFVRSLEKLFGERSKIFGCLETSPQVFSRGPGYLPGFPIEAFGNGGFEMRADEITSAFSLPGSERKIVNLRGTL